MYILQLIEIRCITLVSNVTRNGREIDVEKASCFAPGNSVRRSISIGSPTKRLREWNGDDEKGNEETDGEYNRTTEWDKKWYRQQKREKEKEWRREREKGLLLLWYYSVLACTTTYTVQSTEQPDTHFRHLRLDALGDQCFHSTLCRHRWLEVYKSVTCNTIITIWALPLIIFYNT